MRPRAPNAGTNRELAVIKVLAEEGWLCASRRHIGGAGDVLAVRQSRSNFREVGAFLYEPRGVDALLIEVKSTAGGPWERFGPADRQALIDTAERHGAEAWLYWHPPRGKLVRIHSSEFPAWRNKAEVEGA